MGLYNGETCVQVSGFDNLARAEGEPIRVYVLCGCSFDRLSLASKYTFKTTGLALE